MQLQSLFRGPAGEGREIVTGEKPPLAIEHRDLQFIAVVPDKVDFASEYTQVWGVLILEPKSQYFDLGERGAAHIL
jgi:hypothetical protein